jgi:hypothetical protein
MERTPRKNMGRSRNLRLRFSSLFHPNPGKLASGLPAAPMWNAKDGMSFPQMQDNSGMLKKSNIATVAIVLS